MPSNRPRFALIFATFALVGLTAAGPALAAPQPPAEQEIIYQGEATGILGRAVIGPKKEQVGRITDVLVDASGQPRAAVIDFGGFMGIGQRRIAVSWRALHFLPAGEHPKIEIELTIDQIKATPDWKPLAGQEEGPMTMAAPPASAGSPPPAK